METTLKARPNHYETLGLAPSAASDEIAAAFARESSVFRPHGFGGIAEVFTAYATLRDPIKRRAYDASIGLGPELRPSAPQADPQPAPFVHPALGSMKAASPRLLEEREAADRLPAFMLAREPRHQSGRDAEPAPERQFSSGPPYAELERQLTAEPGEVDWKRTGMMLGGVVLAACLVGGLAGWWSASDIGETQQAAEATPAPPAEAKQFVDTEVPPAPAYPAEPRPEPPRRAVAARPAPAPVSPQVDAEDQPQEIAAAADQAQASTSEEPVEATQATSASLPLPNKLVARTIERIGYSCGAVASTTAVEGAAPGVYKVTCTSGQSYQAKPVNGRYRFRRLGRR